MTFENRKKNIQILIGLCSVALVAWLGIKIVEAFKANAKAFQEDLPSVYTIPTEDSNLINPHYRKQLKVLEVRRSKVRNNIAVLSIGEEYTVILQKLKLLPGSSLTKAVHIAEASTDRSTGVSYAIIDHGNFTYQYKAGNVESNSDLYLTLSGSTIENLGANDSLISYSLQANALSLQYGADSPVDTYMTAKGYVLATKGVPMNIMLLKKDDAVYFIVLTAKDGKQLPKPDAIYEIIAA